MTEQERFEIQVYSTIHCVDFRRFNVLAEELLGHEIYTHELADIDLWLNMQIALLAERQWKPKRTESPKESLKRLMKDKPILTLELALPRVGDYE